MAFSKAVKPVSAFFSASWKIVVGVWKIVVGVLFTIAVGLSAIFFSKKLLGNEDSFLAGVIFTALFIATAGALAICWVKEHYKKIAKVFEKALGQSLIGIKSINSSLATPHQKNMNVLKKEMAAASRRASQENKENIPRRKAGNCMPENPCAEENPFGMFEELPIPTRSDNKEALAASINSLKETATKLAISATESTTGTQTTKEILLATLGDPNDAQAVVDKHEMVLNNAKAYVKRAQSFMREVQNSALDMAAERVLAGENPRKALGNVAREIADMTKPVRMTIETL
jgi:hypothetical protein